MKTEAVTQKGLKARLDRGRALTWPRSEEQVTTAIDAGALAATSTTHVPRPMSDKRGR
jgi:hypothetical protein